MGDDDCAEGDSECSLSFRQLLSLRKLRQTPSYENDFSNAESALPNGGNVDGQNVGGLLREAENDYRNALKSRAEAQADQAQLENIYHNTANEEAQWDKQEG